MENQNQLVTVSKPTTAPVSKFKKLAAATAVSVLSISPAFALTATDVTTDITASKPTVDAILIALIGVAVVIWIGRKALGLIGK